MNKNVAAHKMVRSVAIGLAIEVYEELMAKDNERYARWKRLCPDLTPERVMKRWVRMAWPAMIPAARATLARMLKGNYSDHLKAEIADALIKDNTLRIGTIKTVLH